MNLAETVSLGAIAMLIVMEFCIGHWRKRPAYGLQDSAANIGLYLLYLASKGLYTLVLAAPFLWVWQHRVFDITAGVSGLVLLVLVLDFCDYWVHRAAHAWGFWWADHAPHHSSGLFNVSTTFRQGLTELITGRWLVLLIIPLLGFDPVMWPVAMAFRLFWNGFTHWSNCPTLGFLDKVFITPVHHRLHHAVNAPYVGHNLGGLLTLWDRMFGTFKGLDPRTPPVFAPTVHAPTANPLKVAFAHWGVFIGELWARRALQIRPRHLGAIVALLATLVVSDRAIAAPVLTWQDCPFSLPQGESARCGTLRVGGDPTSHESHALFFAIIDAVNPDKAGEPLLMIPGGPGESATLVIDNDFWQKTQLLRNQHSLILMDPRGTGRSQPSLNCPEVNVSGPIEAISASVRACYARLSAKTNLSALTDDALVHDLIALRMALKIDRWNIFGVSYGGFLALTLLQEDNAATGAAILDSPATSPSFSDIDAALPMLLKQAWLRLQQSCHQEASCKAAFPDIRAALVDLSKTLAVSPLVLEDRSAATQQRLFIYESPSAVFARLKFRLSYSEFHGGLPALVRDLNNRADDTRILRAFEGDIFGQMAHGVLFSMSCRYDQSGPNADANQKAVQDNYPWVHPGSLNGTFLNEVCPHWPVQRISATAHSEPTSSTPVLILSGVYDLQTSPASHAELVASFTNGQLISFPHIGHAVRNSVACVDGLIGQFLAAPSEVVQAETCLSRIRRPEFDIY